MDPAGEQQSRAVAWALLLVGLFVVALGQLLLTANGTVPMLMTICGGMLAAAGAILVHKASRSSQRR